MEAGVNAASLGGRPPARPGKSKSGGELGLKPAGLRRQRAFRIGLVRVVLQVGAVHALLAAWV